MPPSMPIRPRSPASRRPRAAGGTRRARCARCTTSIPSGSVRRAQRRRWPGARSSTSAAAADCWPRPWRARARASSASTSPRTCSSVARLHALDAGVAVDYRLESAEQHAAEHAGRYDVVTCMEMLEHVPDPAAVVAALAALVRPGGEVFVSTLNRTPRAYLNGDPRRGVRAAPAADRHAHLREVHPPVGTRRLGPRRRTRARGRRRPRLRPVLAHGAPHDGRARELPDALPQAGSRGSVHESHRGALLLDLDGTLLDTAPDMGGALNRLRAEHGLEPLPSATIRPVVSHGAMRLVSLGFPEATGDAFETLRLRFLELYAAHLREARGCSTGSTRARVARGARRCPGASSRTSRAGSPIRCSRRSASTAARPARSAATRVAERKPHPLPLLHAAGLIGVAAGALRLRRRRRARHPGGSRGRHDHRRRELRLPLGRGRPAQLAAARHRRDAAANCSTGWPPTLRRTRAPIGMNALAGPAAAARRCCR